jgi:tetratricopeptide (TPR) repeat protein
MAIDGATEVARGLHLQGRIAEAEALYRDLLGKQPDALSALEGLGVVLFQQGRAEEAAALFARGVAIDPRSIRFHANLGEALRSTRQFDRALAHLRKAVSLGPTDVQAWNSLGLVAFDLHRYAAAEHAYREAIRRNPRFVHAQINLANTLHALGRSGEATDALRAALRIEANNPLALINLARMLCETRDPRLLDEAETVGRRAVTLAPQLPLALTTLARALRLRGRLDEAAEYEERARKLVPGRQSVPPNAPDGPDKDPPDAEVASASKSTLDGSPTHGQHSQGLAYLSDGRLDLAETCLREAIKLDPNMAVSWIALAEVDAERGDIERSCQSARTALAVRPDLPEAHWRLATNLLGRLHNAEVQAMESLVPNESLSNDDRALLHFGLAAVHDRRGHFSRAAAQLEIANLHQSGGKFARGLAYNSDTHSEFIGQIIDNFTSEFLARGIGWGDADIRPVFVVGFPRSGTTLTEQILASHPSVKGAGELHDLHRVYQSLPEIVGDSTINRFEALKRLGPITTKAAARRYLDTLDSIAPTGASRVVDKMPDNVNYLGLIALLFPRAKVIICRRDPRDIAVSCWQTGFRTCPWNNNSDHIARRLADYQRMVAHWEHVKPLPCLELPYEDLVADLERHTRLLIDFVGLDWDPSCLEFHSNPRVVRTPSLAQVRQPIHSRSAGRWRNYEPYLQPLFQALDRHGVNTAAQCIG